MLMKIVPVLFVFLFQCQNQTRQKPPGPKPLPARKKSNFVFMRVKIGEVSRNSVIQSTGKLTLYRRGKKITSTMESIPISYSPHNLKITSETGRFTFAGIEYRGHVLLSPLGSHKTLVVNEVEMEDYLLSVIPSEMPPKWNLTALKVQAICARSYAYAAYKNRHGRRYDVEKTVTSQVYGGIRRETLRTTRAVLATQGQILTHKNKVVSAFFHSNSGGITIPAGEIWPVNVSFTYSVLSQDYSASNYIWRYETTLEKLAKKLRKKWPIANITGIHIGRVSRYGRIKTLKIATDTGQKTISLRSFRRLISYRIMRSKCFDIRQNHNKIVFWGFGYGHGVGLSQWGAYAMSRKGYTVQQILSYYYRNIKLAKIGQERS